MQIVTDKVMMKAFYDINFPNIAQIFCNAAPTNLIILYILCFIIEFFVFQKIKLTK